MRFLNWSRLPAKCGLSASVVFVIVCLHVSALPGLAQAIITTYAGGPVVVDGTQAITQGIGETSSVVSDGAGGFYVSAQFQHQVYRVYADGYLEIIAGAGSPGFSGDGGSAASARLFYPSGLTLDRSGNLFIADSANRRIRKVTPDRIISTVAGGGSGGPCCSSGDGGPATSAQLHSPVDVAVDASGTLFIADSQGARIRKVTPAGVISTMAGTGVRGFSGDGGPATSAQLYNPTGIALDGGNVLIADTENNRIRRVSPDGTIATVAGRGLGFGGDGGLAVLAYLYRPSGVALDEAGNLFIADSGNSRIRKVTPGGIISTVAGTATSGFTGDGGPAISAQLQSPYDVAADSTGSLLVADSYNQRIRKVAANGVINTVAGRDGSVSVGDSGPATSVLLSLPSGVASDGQGSLFIADSANHRVRKITPDGTIVTFAGNGSPGFSGDGGSAVFAQIASPFAVAVDPSGNVFIAGCDRRIRKVSPAGEITTVSNIDTWGFCLDDYFDDVLARSGIAADVEGNLLIAEASLHRIRKVTPTGVISTVAGDGTSGFGGDGGPATAAKLSYPSAVAVDGSGNLFIADPGNSRVRRVTPDGIIGTVAGVGAFGFAGDGGAATSARLSYVTSIAVDSFGNLFIADSYFNNRIRKVGRDGVIRTVAGSGEVGFLGDGGEAPLAQLSYPGGIAVDATGNLFIADTDNNRIRLVVAPSFALTLTGASPNFGAPGTTVRVSLTGTNLLNLLDIGNLDAGSGILVTDTNVSTNVLAETTLVIAPTATLGPRRIAAPYPFQGVEIPFTVVPPFPDLSIKSSHTGTLTVGFDGTYTMEIANKGSAATAGAMMVIDFLPLGLSFVSGAGSGWSCSASGQSVACTRSEPLAAGASTTLTLTVHAGANAPPRLIHAPRVSVDGDLVALNNSTADITVVSSSGLRFQFDPPLVSDTLPPGKQINLELTLPLAFPHDVSGSLKMAFSSNATIPSDDPAIQFSNGGREISFTVPANTLHPRFGGTSEAHPVPFQTGTVAGTLTFNGTLETGTDAISFSSTHTIPRQPPEIRAVRMDGPALVINLMSTAREIRQLVLRFETTPAVRLSCSVGCSALGSTLTLDVKSLFDTWFTQDAINGSLSSLRLPLTIQGSVSGRVWVAVANSLGWSDAVPVALP